MRMIAIRRAATLLCLAAATLMPQTPDAAPRPADPVIRVTVNLVQVDAVVTDAKGNHVTDLQPGDFEILEDGKPQKITNFSFIDLKPAQAAAQRTSSGAAGSQPARSPGREDIHRSIVLMIDDLGTPYPDVLGVMGSVKKFIGEQMAPGDLVAVTASRGGMGFYQQFTSDKRQLIAAVDRLAQRPGFGQWVIDTPRGINLAPGEPPFGYRDLNNPPNPIGYLTWAIQGLQDVPGRKAVVLFSHSFAAPQSVVNLANRSGVVIYVIDPSGVDYGHPLIATDAPYKLLAEQTGGLWIKSLAGAALNADLGKVLDDMSGYYLIGYHPDRSDFELLGGRPVHHDIAVKVLRPGLTVRARNGYMGLPDGAGRAAPRTREDYLQRALFSPFSAGGIRLRLDPVYGASAPNTKTKKHLPVLRTMLEVDGRDVRFTDADGGGKKLVLDVLVAVFNQDGTPAASADQRFTLSATAKQAEELAASGMNLTKDVELARPGPYQLRAAVRDVEAGVVGSAYAYVDVPDFNKPEIALSSLVLSGKAVAGRRAGGGSDSSPETEIRMGRGEFAAGTTVHFGCEVFGAKTARPQGSAKVDMEIRLFREGTEVYDSQPLPVPAVTLAQHLLAGNLNIREDMAPGDYAMEVVAYDRLASPRKQMTSQWVDLTVVKPEVPSQ